MNKQQKIFNILAKEQKSMKVELGMVNEIRQELEQSAKISSDALTIVFDAERVFEKSLQSQKQIMAKIEKALQAAKELGADSTIKDLEKYLGISKENVKYIQSALNSLGKIGA